MQCHSAVWSAWLVVSALVKGEVQKGQLHSRLTDTRLCIVVGYTMNTMYFGWLDNAAEVDPAVELPQFTLKDIILFDCSQNYTAG